jgi:hypothetical protein
MIWGVLPISPHCRICPVKVQGSGHLSPWHGSAPEAFTSHEHWPLRGSLKGISGGRASASYSVPGRLAVWKVLAVISRLARLSLRVPCNYHTPMPEVAPMTALTHLAMWCTGEMVERDVQLAVKVSVLQVPGWCQAWRACSCGKLGTWHPGLATFPRRPPRQLHLWRRYACTVLLLLP